MGLYKIILAIKNLIIIATRAIYFKREDKISILVKYIERMNGWM
jgi:hypothetical protein